jgi:uncharacterized YigZ family protein
MNYYYKTIGKEGFAEYKDRGSRFLAFTYPISSVEAFKAHLSQLKKAHPKAVHHCFAYRLGLDNNNFRVSDDGEPSGSAGRPILGQIDSKGLTNVLIVVVRYFGGTLLGVPGLINAYKSSASMALQVTPEVEKAVEQDYRIHCNYDLLNEVMTILKQVGCTIHAVEQSLFCKVHAGIPLYRLDTVLHKLNDIYGVEVIADKSKV